jgi:hypothetical protein
MTTDEITVDYCRGLNIVDLKRLEHPIAKRQTQLREVGESLIRGVLRALTGCVFSNTGGWHIAAYVTADGQLGYVNIAHGAAVLTDVRLERQTIEALTIPEQSEGPMFSGAAIYTSPDVGEAHRSEAPRGWTQLVLDLRGEDPVVPCTAHVCAWGLRTCYDENNREPNGPGRRGEPGVLQLADHNARSLPDGWLIPDAARARMHAAAAPIIQRITLDVAEMAGLRDEMQAAITSGGLAAAWTLAFESRGRTEGGYTALASLNSAINTTTGKVIRDALRRHGVSHMLALGGDNLLTGPYDYRRTIGYLLERALTNTLAPIAQALFAAHAPLIHTTREDTLDVFRETEAMLCDVADHTSDILLRGIVKAGDERAILDALYAEGYLEMYVPIALPSPSPN